MACSNTQCDKELAKQELMTINSILAATTVLVSGQIQASITTIKAFEAENMQRASCDQSVAYGDAEFFETRNQIETQVSVEHFKNVAIMLCKELGIKGVLDES